MQRLAWALLSFRADMFKLRRSSIGQRSLYFVTGRIDAEAVSELQRLLGQESAVSRVILDLKEVRLVEAEAVEYLEGCEDAGIRFRHCPAYVREWIDSSRRQA